MERNLKLYLDSIPKIVHDDGNAVLVFRQMDEEGKPHNLELVFFPEEAVQVGALLQAYGQKLLLAND